MLFTCGDIAGRLCYTMSTAVLAIAGVVGTDACASVMSMLKIFIIHKFFIKYALSIYLSPLLCICVAVLNAAHIVLQV